MPPDITRVKRVLEVRRIFKYFGDFSALRDVSLRVTAGESVLIYGANGAGKTTLLRVLAYLSRPSEGEIFLDGVYVPRPSEVYKRRIGFVSHSTFLYDDLTVRENLRLTGKLFRLEELDPRIDALLELFALGERAGDFVRTLSRGLQQRVTLARALLHDPDFVLLDEPFTGLDTASCGELERLLRRLPEQGRAVIFSTHSFAQGVSIAGRLVALEKGKLRYDGPVPEKPWASWPDHPEGALAPRPA